MPSHSELRAWALAAATLVSFAHASTLTFTPLADGYIRARQTTSQTANVTNPVLFIGDTTTASDYLRTVLAFDLNTPALTNGKIANASLILTVESVDTASGGSVDAQEAMNLHALSSSFDEAAVSWYSRDGTNNWTTPGGDYGPIITSATADPATVAAGNTITFSGTGLISSVNAAIGGSYYLLGKLASENAVRSVFRFSSRTGANPPRLVVDYTSATPLPGNPLQATSSRYTVTVDGQPVQVKAERFGFDVAMFTQGSVPATVNIMLSGTTLSSFTLKPVRYGFPVSSTTNSVQFTMTSPQKMVLEVPGLTPLAIIATPAEVAPPAPGTPGVTYFPAGTTTAGVIRPTSGSTVYFAPGALVKGRLEIKDVSNVTVSGRGFLETQGYAVWDSKTDGILVQNANNVSIEGISVRDYNSYWQTLYLNSRNVTVSNVNIFGTGKNTDGVDIDAVKDFTVRDSFIRGEDDGLGWHSYDAQVNGEMITERALADNVVIWNTAAGNGVRIGASMEGQLWRDITIRNIDVLQHAVSGLYSDYSDWAWMRNLTFENVAIERGNSPINFRILKTTYSNNNGYLDERGHFTGLTFNNITMSGGTVRMEGYDATHRIDKVRFNNCTNAGVALTSTSQLALNSYVTNLFFNQSQAVASTSAPGVFEAEDLESITNLAPQYLADEPASSQGCHRVFAPAAIGSYVEHLLNVPSPGIYRLKIRARQTAASGIAQLTVGGVAVGTERDFYSPATTYQEFDYGTLNIAASGTIPIRLTVTGRNAASSGLRIEIDSFKLLTPAQAWRDDYFKTTWNSGTAADTADPDGDNLPNLLEFALGTSPSVAGSSGITTLTNPQTGQPMLSFSRLSPAPVTYICEASANLVDWTPVATLTAGTDTWTGTATIVETPTNSGMKQVSLSDSISPGYTGSRFFRLRVVGP